MSEAPFKIYNVEEAMIRFALPEVSERLQELAPHARTSSTQTEHLHREYRRLEEFALESLKEKLLRGELKARCFGPHASLTDKKIGPLREGAVRTRHIGDLNTNLRARCANPRQIGLRIAPGEGDNRCARFQGRIESKRGEGQHEVNKERVRC